MYYSREQQKRFLDLELQAISEEYIKKLNTQSIILLDKNEIYVTQYVKIKVPFPVKKRHRTTHCQTYHMLTRIFLPSGLTSMTDT